MAGVCKFTIKKENTMEKGAGIAIGVAIGTAIGVATGSLGLWIGIGVVVGVLIENGEFDDWELWRCNNEE